MSRKIATYHWSRAPGVFLNKLTGEEYSFSEFGSGPVFHGSVREWYETLAENIHDAATRAGAKDAGVVITSPDVLVILEHMVGYKPYLTIPGEDHSNGPIGIISNRWQVYYGSVKFNQLLVSATKDSDFVEIKILNMPRI